MRAKSGWALVCVLGWAVCLGMALAQSAPELINYQGRLTNAAGQPLDGDTVDLTFTFYPSELSGAPLLTVTQPGVLVSKGIYNVLIGSGGILTGSETTLADVFQKHTEVWMGVQVNADPEMTPRTRISSTAYALMAGKAQTAETTASMDPNWLKQYLAQDSDGDGYYKTDDCNDDNASINPKAIEVCDDGTDKNCINGDCYRKGFYDTPGNADDVWVSGNYAYVADGSAGLQIINVSNPAAPTLAGTYDTPGNAVGVFVYLDYAYVADWTAGLQIINISNPLLPTLAGTYDTPGTANAVVAYSQTGVGNYVYVADGLAGVQILDCDTVSAPILVGTYDTPGNAKDISLGVYAQGRYALVADSSGLLSINVTAPAAPALASSLDLWGAVEGLYLRGIYAYAVGGPSVFFKIVNISDPERLFTVGGYGLAGYSTGVFAYGAYAYVSENMFSMISILNVSNPAAVTRAGYIPSLPNVHANNLFAVGNYIYIADAGAGLQIYYAMTPP